MTILLPAKSRDTNFTRTGCIAILLALLALPLRAQIGEHRDDLAVGGGAGVTLSSVGFMPKVSQGLHVGPTFGVAARYVCEKYYTMVCSVLGEVNFASLGWKEDILDPHDDKVINSVTGKAEEYSRTINYIQVPIFAHLAWGREVSGCNFFFQAGPQIGMYLGESTSKNFDFDNINLNDRSNKTHEQYSMKVEKKFDYGIAGGLGMEYSHPRLGHFLLEGRYYYGLGNIYGATKRDYFGVSNFSAITIRLTYLLDLKTTKDAKRK